jgi:hypothetical protein
MIESPFRSPSQTWSIQGSKLPACQSPWKQAPYREKNPVVIESGCQHSATREDADRTSPQPRPEPQRESFVWGCQARRNALSATGPSNPAGVLHVIQKPSRRVAAAPKLSLPPGWASVWAMAFAVEAGPRWRPDTQTSRRQPPFVSNLLPANAHRRPCWCGAFAFRTRSGPE